VSGVLRIVDLFAGAGGTTTGMLEAAEELGLETEAVAVNHWPTAVATHTENHRQVRHYCADIQAVDPRTVVPNARITAAPTAAAPSATRSDRARTGCSTGWSSSTSAA
jgi:DNA (cytosine-5)-methyltransferase 1